MFPRWNHNKPKLPHTRRHWQHDLQTQRKQKQTEEGESWLLQVNILWSDSYFLEVTEKVVFLFQANAKKVKKGRVRGLFENKKRLKKC